MMKPTRTRHAAGLLGWASVVTVPSTLVFLLSLGYLVAGPPAAVQARPATPTWLSRLTPLSARPGTATRSMDLFYEASWSKWLQAGSVRMSFATSGGPIRATTHARSKGPVHVIWPYESKTSSWISPQTLIPSRLVHVQTERGVTAESEADYGRGIMRVQSIITSRESAGPVRETQTFHLDGIRDVHSALLFLQRADLKSDQSIVLLVQPVDSLYLVSLDVAGRERRKVRNEQRDTIRLNVRIRKVMDDLSLAPDARMRSATLWVSDDENRIPLEIRADVFIGFVSVRLVGHSVN